jgi:hypothetical protein
MLDHSCQVQRHTDADRGFDCYETPKVAVKALLKVETLSHHIWEPACGGGNIVEALDAAGYDVWASDLHDHGCGEAGVDFLTAPWPAGFPLGAIVTNPPYRWAQKFVERALELSPLVIMLMRLAFYESERRCHILEDCGLARIHCFRKRLPMMHRKNWDGPKANSGMAFAWFVWSRDHIGPTTIDRISWER